MQGTDQDSGGAQLSVGWQDGVPEPGDHGLERAASYSALLTRTLAAAGYHVRRLDIGLRRGAGGILEITVRGDVPDMPEQDFASLARVTLNAARLADEGHGAKDVLLWATLQSAHGVYHATDTRRDAAAVVAPSPRPTTSPGILTSFPWGRLIAALVMGLALGVLGLPRLELPFLTTLTASEQQSRTLIAQPDAATSVSQARATPASALAELPTAVPLLPAPLPAQRARPPTPTAVLPQVVFGEPLLRPLPNWPNKPDGTAWFGADGFHLFARESGRFVAVGVPTAQPLSSAVLTARFHKVGGPAGGGYGLIVRDQGSTTERDGRNQAGKYMVVEVGDRGDAGIWQRNEARWIDVMPWTHSDAVNLDRGSNALVVTIRDSVLRFEVNGQVLADLIYDGIPSRGGVGIFVGGDLNEVILDSLRIEN